MYFKQYLFTLNSVYISIFKSVILHLLYVEVEVEIALEKGKN